jgi:NAD(P)-dependent dehydrogenase (short-subunit alcohol dehydrogenase family)
MYTALTSFVRQDWQDLWNEQIPYKRMGTPKELAGGVIYLLSDASTYTTGTDLIIDGGYTCI